MTNSKKSKKLSRKGMMKNSIFNILFLFIISLAGFQIIALLKADGSSLETKLGEKDQKAQPGIPIAYTIAYSDILGAGASFPFPLYAKMFAEYLEEKKIRVNYQSIGSGGGVRQITAQTVDFGASDSPLNDAELAAFQKKGQTLLHVPIVMGAVAITYNLPAVPELTLNGQVLADIYSGKIRKWNNRAIEALNKGLRLPNQSIIAVHRSDGSGTTFVLSDFLAYSSSTWKAELGVGKSLRWFRGALGAKGNEGVTQQVKNIPGAIGYVSLNYALQAKLPVAAIQNAEGNAIRPSAKSVSLSAQGSFPADTRIRLSGKPTKGAGYPISTLTWILVHQDQAYGKRTMAEAQELKDLLSWMISDAQIYARPLYYAPLPKTARQKANAVLQQMKYKQSKL